MLSNLFDEDFKNKIENTVFQIKCYLLLIVIILIIIAYYTQLK